MNATPILDVTTFGTPKPLTCYALLWDTEAKQIHESLCALADLNDRLANRCAEPVAGWLRSEAATLRKLAARIARTMVNSEIDRSVAINAESFLNLALLPSRAVKEGA